MNHLLENWAQLVVRSHVCRVRSRLLCSLRPLCSVSECLWPGQGGLSRCRLLLLLRAPTPHGTLPPACQQGRCM